MQLKSTILSTERRRLVMLYEPSGFEGDSRMIISSVIVVRASFIFEVGVVLALLLVGWIAANQANADGMVAVA